MKFIKYLFFALLCSVIGCTNSDTVISQDDVLWYTAPAPNWDEALPLGNGRLGVMVFGDPHHERIQLNDDSLWPSDSEEWDAPDGTPEDLETIRSLLFEGNQEEADRLFVERFSRKEVVRSHQTLGDLFIDFDHKDVSEYRRELNISDATSSISYKADGHLTTEEVYVSHPHKAIIIELTSESPNGINAAIRLSRPDDMGHPTATTYTTSDGLLEMKGEVTQRGGKFDSKETPILNGVKFLTTLKVKNLGGEVLTNEDHLRLEGVSKATLIIVSNTSYYHDDYPDQNAKDLEEILSTEMESVKQQHISDYQNLYNRVRLDLHHRQDTLPTDTRLDLVKAGERDNGLAALLFQFGRYLLISSSRAGTNPANLQGLWNQHIQAPWNADYHLNINLQMNYWLADMTGLSELNAPLFDYIDRLIPSGRTTARVNFGCRGSFIPHATDLWAPTWLRAPTAYWGCSVGAGGWLMQHYWQHYLYTMDEQFLKDRAFPAMTAVAQFYSDWLITDPRDGSLISAPSTSPENRYYNDRGNKVASCLGSAMDQQVIHEVFQNYLAASDVLGQDDALRDTIEQQIAQLRPGFVIDTTGRILEWDRPYQETSPGHRHMSHLYGFHPGTNVTQSGDSLVFNAVRSTLDYRLANGGAGTGWSRAWLINCSARLLDGEMAEEHIQQLLSKSISTNLFDLHPPFQIDGNFGYTAGVAEMLLQSHEVGLIRLLPALPLSWDAGHVTGLRARGGLTVDLYWSEHQLDRVTIYSDRAAAFDIAYGDVIMPVTIEKDGVYNYDF